MSSFFFVFPLLFLPLVTHAQITTIAAGPYAFQTGEYHLPASVMPEIRSDMKTELWAKTFWPKIPASLAEPLPILFFLHGNHATCGRGAKPIDTMGCEYSETGQCSDGSTVILNHEGYDYVAENLASFGYVVVSINANLGVTCANGLGTDSGANLVRGRLILKHIELWHQWNQGQSSPLSLSQNPQEFFNRISLNHAGLMGHSRGGEGARAALAQYLDLGSPWKNSIPTLKIEGIYEIGAVDGQAGRVLDADTTNWHQLLPACDGDVSNLAGSKPFFRMLKKNPQTLSGQKSLSLVYGTNHNFYNTVWDQSDASQYNCDGQNPVWTNTPWVDVVQPQVSAFMMNHFFRSYVGVNKVSALTKTFDPAEAMVSALNSITRIDRDFVNFDFPQNISVINDLESTAPAGIPPDHYAEGSHVTVKSQVGGKLVSWTAAGDQERFVILVPPANRNFLARRSLQLRLSLGRSTKLSTPRNFSVSLLDGGGRESARLPVSRYATLDRNGTSKIDFYQPLRISLDDFAKSVDLTQVEKVILTFNESTAGQIIVSQLRLVDDAGYKALATPIVPLSLNSKTRVREQPVGPEQPLATAAALETHALLQKINPLPKRIYVNETQSKISWKFLSPLKVRIEIESEIPFIPKDELLTLSFIGKVYRNARMLDFKTLKKIGFDVDAKDILQLVKGQHLNKNVYVSYGELEQSPKIWITR